MPPHAIVVASTFLPIFSSFCVGVVPDAVVSSLDLLDQIDNSLRRRHHRFRHSRRDWGKPREMSWISSSPPTTLPPPQYYRHLRPYPPFPRVWWVDESVGVVSDVKYAKKEWPLPPSSYLSSTITLRSPARSRCIVDISFTSLFLYQSHELFHGLLLSFFNIGRFGSSLRYDTLRYHLAVNRNP